VAGDELVWMLRRINEEWGTAVVLAEHRLERCLPAADRVLAIEDGAVARDDDPAGFLQWDLARGGDLSTPVARLFDQAGLTPPPTSVKQAREALRRTGLQQGGQSPRVAQRTVTDPSLRVRDVWCELEDGPQVLRGVDLDLRPGELVALMGRNGAGKSTLLRHIKGLVEPTRGRIERTGDVALLLQNPGDYLIHDHARQEAGAEALEPAGIAGRGEANPRDLSGGQRQRLALEVVLGGGPCAVVCLDEPTRGMDRVRKDALAARLELLAADGAAVLVATHDTEFAAHFARRVVLMGQGDLIADGTAEEVLAGGWHSSTETARVLDGAGGALTPEQGGRMLERQPVAR